VFAGSESFLLATLRGGGAGCITALANVNPGRSRRSIAAGGPDADARQAALDAVRGAFQKFPMIGRSRRIGASRARRCLARGSSAVGPPECRAMRRTARLGSRRILDAGL